MDTGRSTNLPICPPPLLGFFYNIQRFFENRGNGWIIKIYFYLEDEF